MVKAVNETSMLPAMKLTNKGDTAEISLSPLSVARATLALNNELCFLRFCFMFCSSYSVPAIFGLLMNGDHYYN